MDEPRPLWMRPGRYRYADLRLNRLHDYKFSFEKMLQFRGDTAGTLWPNAKHARA